MFENINELNKRFRGFYPVVVDIETSGFDPAVSAILEIAVTTLCMDENGWLVIDKTVGFNVNPFPDAVIEPESVAFIGIDLTSLLRQAIDECIALENVFEIVRKGIKKHHCNRAVVVAHNASFDHSFIMAAAKRCKIKRNPFHPFTTFDTAALSALVYGQTVLAKACQAANIEFVQSNAHSALYDSEMTAHLFCDMVNRWKNKPPA